MSVAKARIRVSWMRRIFMRAAVFPLRWARNSVGVIPMCRLKMVLKYCASGYPVASAIS